VPEGKHRTLGFLRVAAVGGFCLFLVGLVPLVRFGAFQHRWIIGLYIVGPSALNRIVVLGTRSIWLRLRSAAIISVIFSIIMYLVLQITPSKPGDFVEDLGWLDGFVILSAYFFLPMTLLSCLMSAVGVNWRKGAYSEAA
jgi:hypothetical protein